MQELIKKLEKLISLAKAIKAPNAVAIPALPKPAVPGAVPVQVAKPSKIPGMKPSGNKNPTKVAEQLKNAETLKQNMPTLKSDNEEVEKGLKSAIASGLVGASMLIGGGKVAAAPMPTKAPTRAPEMQADTSTGNLLSNSSEKGGSPTFGEKTYGPYKIKTIYEPSVGDGHKSYSLTHAVSWNGTPSPKHQAAVAKEYNIKSQDLQTLKPNPGHVDGSDGKPSGDTWIKCSGVQRISTGKGEPSGLIHSKDSNDIRKTDTPKSRPTRSVPKEYAIKKNPTAADDANRKYVFKDSTFNHKGRNKSMETLIKHANGQWSLKKSVDDDFPDPNRHQKAWASYKKVEPKTQYQVHGLNNKTKNWSHGNEDALAHYGDNLSAFPHETADQYNKASANWQENRRDPYPKVPIAKDLQSVFNKEHHAQLHENNGYWSDRKGSAALLGYDAGTPTKEVVDGRDTYHVFHTDTNGKYAHVGQYEIDPDSGEVNVMHGSANPDHRHMHETIKNAIGNMNDHQQAITSHNESFEEANPHISELTYDENPEKKQMQSDSFQHFLKNGKAKHFTPAEHLRYLKEHNPELMSHLDVKQEMN